MDILELFSSENIETNLNAIGWHVDSGTAAIFPPLVEEELTWLQSEFLNQSNGLFLKKLTLFGLPVSNSNQLNRSILRPQSLLSANQSWRIKYDITEDSLMIGSKTGWSDNTGIFMCKEGNIICVDKQNTITLKSFKELFDWSQDA
jgi:hypothetical protein